MDPIVLSIALHARSRWVTIARWEISSENMFFETLWYMSYGRTNGMRVREHGKEKKVDGEVLKRKGYPCSQIRSGCVRVPFSCHAAVALPT